MDSHQPTKAPERYERREYRGGFVGPTILIGLGILLLLSNLGMLQWSIWDAAWKLWPILLIAAGLDVLIGRRSAIGSCLSTLIVLALIAGAIAVFAMPGWFGVGGPGPDITGQGVSQPLEGARYGDVTIRPAAASLRVAGGAAEGKLLEGTVSLPAGEAAAGSSRMANDVLYYSLASRDVRPYVGRPGGDRTWDLRLTDQAQLALRVGMGAGQVTADLRGLKLTSVVVEMGAGQAIITVPAGGRLDMRVNVAVGEAVIRVPRGSAVRVNAKMALGTSRLPNGTSHFGASSYSSPGFESTSDRIDVDVSCAIGSIVVQEY